MRISRRAPVGRGLVAVAVSVLLSAATLGCGATDQQTPPPSSPAGGTTTISASPAMSGTATPGSTATPSARPSSPPTSPRPDRVTQRRPGWALDRIDQRRQPLDGRYSSIGQGGGVTVYVVDGLFDVTNAEFGGRASVGLRRGTSCMLESGINHGLFVAGIVAGRHTGVAKQASVVSVGASTGCEGADESSRDKALARIVTALGWVSQHAKRPAVVNLSLNSDRPAPALEAAVERLVAGGLTVVASAGNDGGDACRRPPAGLPGVVTVAAATKNDRDAGLNHGRCVDLFAPAEGVDSVVDAELDPDRVVTSDVTATSWAAPYVSGAAALYLSVHPSASPTDVRAWLIDNSTSGALRGDLHGSPNRLLYTRGPL
ncbi:MAG TPA: S8 family serine peptidase [Microlunatus sp.]|nr:S8 family serine peptidase [Microlunatus sp.]